MKKKYLILSLIVLASCSSQSTALNSVIPSDQESTLNNRLLNELQDNEVILNLTRNGLYQGKKGLKSTDYYLENYIVFTLSEGNALPSKEDITSNVTNVSFTSWCYAGSEGQLVYTNSYITGVKFYQAYFSSSNISETPTTSVTTNPVVSDGSSESTNPSDTSISTPSEGNRNIYLETFSGWESDGAKSLFYTWHDDTPLAKWPGTILQESNDYDVTSGKLYKITLDLSYDKIIFIRQSSDGASIWNQTKDLTIPNGENVYAKISDWDLSVAWETL